MGKDIKEDCIHFIEKRPEELHGIQVTAENMEDVAGWCKGWVERTDYAVWIRVPVPRPKSERMTRAYANDWVVRTRDGMLRIYKNKDLMENFKRVGD